FEETGYQLQQVERSGGLHWHSSDVLAGGDNVIDSFHLRSGNEPVKLFFRELSQSGEEVPKAREHAVILYHVIPSKGDSVPHGPRAVRRLRALDPVFDFFKGKRSEEHTSELQSRENLVCRLLLEKKKREKQKLEGELCKHL